MEFLLRASFTHLSDVDLSATEKGVQNKKTEPRLAGGLIDASGTMSGGGGTVASGGMRPAGKKVRRSSCDVL